MSRTIVQLLHRKLDLRSLRSGVPTSCSESAASHPAAAVFGHVLQLLDTRL